MLQSHTGRSGIWIRDGERRHQGAPAKLLQRHQPPLKYAYRVIKAQWSSRSAKQFEVSLNFTGIDDVGLVNAVTGVISDAMNVNMRAISFNSSDGTFEGRVKVLVTNTDHLKAAPGEVARRARSVECGAGG